MAKQWTNINARYGPKPVQTDFEAHAVSATAFVVMIYTQKARVKEVEQSGKFKKNQNVYLNNCFSFSKSYGFNLCVIILVVGLQHMILVWHNVQ